METKDWEKIKDNEFRTVWHGGKNGKSIIQIIETNEGFFAVRRGTSVENQTNYNKAFTTKERAMVFANHYMRTH